ncbi:TetR family transcriptional regulator [Streptomyces lincolnensis]|uniref:TetR family transcriptional regulator n=1 Tax=Streptomyces lincolnensis TaxID=1915 RepID=A0A1B1ME34_STRLN|nr:TetR family transcriptional regulator [Streptomyces lincolnensis]ANS66886.1 TetR family transcriptional regulator [Streptomyces lincolnensis]AXG55757.1 TetR family transcriptional regulator [Streptomyces lincolnensis]QMV07759.1 TetR family transcriptional regulator [Streptomyces lincolnensis]
MATATTAVTSSSAPPAGLRESKKQETRQLISDHATRLFIAQGFEQTTIAEIAAAARVAKKTVTNYFPRKEDLALDHQDAFIASLAHTVAHRRPGESALTALRRAFTDAATAADPVAGFSGPDFARMIADSPTLTARLRDLHDLRESALATTLATTTDTPHDDITPRTAAALLGAVHRTLFQRIQDLTLADESPARITTTVTTEADLAFDLLEPSLGDYAVA